jgi:trigger factor
MKQMLAANGAAGAHLEGLSDEMFADRAISRVKLGLIVAELTATAAIEPDPAAVRAEIEKVAATYEQPDEVIRWYYEKPERLSEVEALCAENALVDWILERASVTDEPMGFQGLMEANRNSGAA